ncbi:ABC-type transport auxiliary lipoprotein family protein [Alteromonas stellipolaris]|jgi:uncharacterized lipoprotein YmbA|uniref:ABC-type transport auxiliary lipoprotein family protein n=1 Tax=Alteromonas stellipolaris TaxID=233316 RepID=A0AAW7Z7E0_9ALTE|nr:MULTISPECIES: ABC-type transport auxiliary lipoprotein family protein [Alteromonas]AMJ90488.1 hypothetical protein AV940_08375 [Alteromonas sp. Mac2]AMJ86628.1 hypothetical protein AV939_08585 [Alteromonas sp. Mac1]AMJ94330.1 hypothetical protein AVL56_08455 [Alteromonas stellipolaris]ANB23029.1 hypothetical protein A6K25_18255 [Alteromonas stellipolaris]MDO6536747.1 ABC-type transport auxiliary lipoprotein family protein [Alteromonas stellipolaris]
MKIFINYWNALVCSMSKARLGFALLAGASLIGCASSGSALQYYLLHSTTSPSATQYASAPHRLLINKIVLPDYLKQRGLVYQTSSTSLHIATEHLWAEPLDEGITKSLKAALRTQGVMLVTHNVNAKDINDYLTLQIDDFIATWQGDIILRGQYIIKHTNDSQSANDFEYILPLSTDGFPASIEVMREAINALATDIANNISSVQK